MNKKIFITLLLALSLNAEYTTEKAITLYKECIIADLNNEHTTDLGDKVENLVESITFKHKYRIINEWDKLGHNLTKQDLLIIKKTFEELHSLVPAGDRFDKNYSKEYYSTILPFVKQHHKQIVLALRVAIPDFYKGSWPMNEADRLTIIDVIMHDTEHSPLAAFSKGLDFPDIIQCIDNEIIKRFGTL